MSRVQGQFFGYILMCSNQLPIIHIIYAAKGSISNKAAAISPPRSSNKGIREITNIITYFNNIDEDVTPNNPIIQLTNLLAILPPLSF